MLYIESLLHDRSFSILVRSPDRKRNSVFLTIYPNALFASLNLKRAKCQKTYRVPCVKYQKIYTEFLVYITDLLLYLYLCIIQSRALNIRHATRVEQVNEPHTKRSLYIIKSDQPLLPICTVL